MVKTSLLLFISFDPQYFIFFIFIFMTGFVNHFAGNTAVTTQSSNMVKELIQFAWDMAYSLYSLLLSVLTGNIVWIVFLWIIVALVWVAVYFFAYAKNKAKTTMGL